MKTYKSQRKCCSLNAITMNFQLLSRTDIEERMGTANSFRVHIGTGESHDASSQCWDATLGMRCGFKSIKVVRGHSLGAKLSPSSGEYCRTCSSSTSDPLHGIAPERFSHSRCKESTPFYSGKPLASVFQQSPDRISPRALTYHKWTSNKGGKHIENDLSSPLSSSGESCVHMA